jgi:hypothetical protein
MDVELEGIRKHMFRRNDKRQQFLQNDQQEANCVA